MTKNNFLKLKVGDTINRKPLSCWDCTEHWKLIKKHNVLKSDWCFEFVSLESGFHRWISEDNLWLIEDLYL